MFLKELASKNNLKLFTHVRKQQLFSKTNVFNRQIPLFRYNFRSFFGFLKPKPFIYSIKYSWLSFFNLNPRPYTLVQFIKQTKKFNIHQLASNFESCFLQQKTLYFSNLNLIYLLKYQYSNIRSIQFLLFKHKIYNYTTAKSGISAHLKNWSLKLQPSSIIDYRYSTLKIGKLRNITNLSTISTYNWKTIN